MGKKNEEAMTAEHFEDVISKYDYDAVGRMVAQGYLATLGEEARTSTVRRIIMLKDRNLIKLMAKKGVTFTPEMFDIDVSGNKNREIVNYVFKFTKSLDLSGEEEQNAFFEMACHIECIPLLRYMISKHMAAGKYPLLAAGTSEMVDLLLHLGKKEMTNELIIAAYVEAALTNDYQQRIPYLQKKGLDIKAVDEDGLDAAAVLRKRISTIRYSRNKNGELTRVRNQNAGNYLYALIHPAPKKEKPATLTAGKDPVKIRRRCLVGIAAVVIIICAVARITINNANAAASESAASTEATVAEEVTLTEDTSTEVTLMEGTDEEGTDEEGTDEEGTDAESTDEEGANGEEAADGTSTEETLLESDTE